MELIYFDGHRETVESEPIKIVRNIIDYDKLVVEYIRKRYSVSEELAIQRQREDKPEEFAAYYNFCEACKTKARKEVEDANG